MNGVQTRLKCKPNVKRCKRFVFAAHSPLLHPNTLKTKAIIHFQTDHILTRFVFPPLLGTGSSVVFAQEVNNSSAVVAEAQVPQDEFVKMDPTELPQAILLTLAKNYEGSSVKEAYVKVKDEAKIYKIIILTQDGQETETILNEKGEAVKE